METALLLFLLGWVAAAADTGLGGLSEESVDVQTLHVADFAISKVTENTSTEGADLQLVGILSSQKQVVAGLKYNLKLVAQAGEEENVLSAEVYLPLNADPVLENYTVLTGDAAVVQEFSDVREYQQFDTQDEEVLLAANAAVKNINMKSNSLTPIMLDDVQLSECKVESGQGTTCRLMLNLRNGAGDQQTMQVEMNRTLATEWRMLSGN